MLVDILAAALLIIGLLVLGSFTAAQAMLGLLDRLPVRI